MLELRLRVMMPEHDFEAAQQARSSAWNIIDVEGSNEEKEPGHKRGRQGTADVQGGGLAFKHPSTGAIPTMFAFEKEPPASCWRLNLLAGPTVSECADCNKSECRRPCWSINLSVCCLSHLTYRVQFVCWRSLWAPTVQAHLDPGT